MSSTEPQCRLQSDGMMPHKAAMKLWLNLVFHCWVQMKPGPGPSLDVSQRPYKHINWRCEPNNIQILLSSWGWLRPVPGDNTRNETIIIIITILILVNVWSIKLGGNSIDIIWAQCQLNPVCCGASAWYYIRFNWDLWMPPKTIDLIVQIKTWVKVC